MIDTASRAFQSSDSPMLTLREDFRDQRESRQSGRWPLRGMLRLTTTSWRSGEHRGRKTTVPSRSGRRPYITRHG